MSNRQQSPSQRYSKLNNSQTSSSPSRSVKKKTNTFIDKVYSKFLKEQSKDLNSSQDFRQEINSSTVVPKNILNKTPQPNRFKSIRKPPSKNNDQHNLKLKKDDDALNTRSLELNSNTNSLSNLNKHDIESIRANPSKSQFKFNDSIEENQSLQTIPSNKNILSKSIIDNFNQSSKSVDTSDKKFDKFMDKIKDIKNHTSATQLFYEEQDSHYKLISINQKLENQIKNIKSTHMPYWKVRTMEDEHKRMSKDQSTLKDSLTKLEQEQDKLKVNFITIQNENENLKSEVKLIRKKQLDFQEQIKHTDQLNYAVSNLNSQLLVLQNENTDLIQQNEYLKKYEQEIVKDDENNIIKKNNLDQFVQNMKCQIIIEEKPINKDKLNLLVRSKSPNRSSSKIKDNDLDVEQIRYFQLINMLICYSMEIQSNETLIDNLNKDILSKYSIIVKDKEKQKSLQTIVKANIKKDQSQINEINEKNKIIKNLEEKSKTNQESLDLIKKQEYKLSVLESKNYDLNLKIEQYKIDKIRPLRKIKKISTIPGLENSLEMTDEMTIPDCSIHQAIRDQEWSSILQMSLIRNNQQLTYGIIQLYFKLSLENEFNLNDIFLKENNENVSVQKRNEKLEKIVYNFMKNISKNLSSCNDFQICHVDEFRLLLFFFVNQIDCFKLQNKQNLDTNTSLSIDKFIKLFQQEKLKLKNPFRAYHRMDFNKDSLVSFEEFTSLLGQNTVMSTWTLSEIMVVWIDKNISISLECCSTQIFRSINKLKSGITHQIFSNWFIAKLGGIKSSDQSKLIHCMKNIFNKMGAENKSILEFNDFKSNFWRVELFFEGQWQFRWMDSNKNGTLSLEEYKVRNVDLILPPNLPIGQKDRFKMFKSDADEIEFYTFISKYMDFWEKQLIGFAEEERDEIYNMHFDL